MNSEISIPHNIKPPREAYRYLPPKDQVLRGTGKNLQRYIFKGQIFNSLEEKKLKRLEALISAGKLKPYKIPKSWDRSDLLKFVYGTNWKTQKAFKNLLEHLKWISNFLPDDYKLQSSDVMHILQTGCMYVHGRDERYRPLIVLRAFVFDFNKYSVEKYINATCFLLEYIKEHMLLPGQIENWIVLTDMGKQGLNISFKLLKKIIDILQLNYRCRLAHNFVVNAPGSIMIIWNVVKHFLDETTKEKTDIEKSNVSYKLLEMFASNQIEQKYGGTSPDLIEFWPPYVPSRPFQRNSQEVEGLNASYDSCHEDLKGDTDGQSAIQKKRSMSSPDISKPVHEEDSLELEAGYGVFEYNPNESDKHISFHIEEEIKIDNNESLSISFSRNEKVFINRSCVSSIGQNSFELDFVASLESSSLKDNFEPLMTQKIVIPHISEASPESDLRNEKTAKIFENKPDRENSSAPRNISHQDDTLKVENENLKTSCFGFNCGDFEGRKNENQMCTLL